MQNECVENEMISTKKFSILKKLYLIFSDIFTNNLSSENLNSINVFNFTR